MTEPASPPATARVPRWMTALLVVSLAINLLVAGAMIGATFGRDRAPDRDAVVRDLGRSPFVAALDAGDRREIGRRMIREAMPLRTNRADLRERFEALLGALRAEEFDRATAERLIADQRDSATRRQEIGERILLDHIAGLSLEARRAYADRLDRSIRRGP